MILKKLCNVVVASVLTAGLVFSGVREAKAAVEISTKPPWQSLTYTEKSPDEGKSKGRLGKYYITKIYTRVDDFRYDDTTNVFTTYYGITTDTDTIYDYYIEVQCREKINGVYTKWITAGYSETSTAKTKTVCVKWDMDRNANLRLKSLANVTGTIEMRFLVHKRHKTGNTYSNVTSICGYIEDINYDISLRATAVKFSLDSRLGTYVGRDGNTKELAKR